MELSWHIRAIAYMLSHVKILKFYWPMGPKFKPESVKQLWRYRNILIIQDSS